MVHDPRAPRLAAAATLCAAVLVLLTALNLVLNLIGSSGPSIEEAAALAGVGMSLFIANLANKERTIPELIPSSGRSDVESFDTLTTMTTGAAQSEVNPTTASILTSILGEQATADQQQVNSAINTLSSGEFGDSVRRTMEEVEAANQTINDQHEAAPADEETGQTMERVLVQPVPLPGHEDEPIINPASIPGLEPNRVFVTSGVASVPLPNIEPNVPTTPAVSQTPVMDEPSVTPVIPDLPDLPELPDMLTLPEVETPQEPQDAVEVPAAPTFDLPDLDGLFDDEPVGGGVKEVPSVPNLPDLDDLF